MNNITVILTYTSCIPYSWKTCLCFLTWTVIFFEKLVRFVGYLRYTINLWSLILNQCVWKYANFSGKRYRHDIFVWSLLHHIFTECILKWSYTWKICLSLHSPCYHLNPSSPPVMSPPNLSPNDFPPCNVADIYLRSLAPCCLPQTISWHNVAVSQRDISCCNVSNWILWRYICLPCLLAQCHHLPLQWLTVQHLSHGATSACSVAVSFCNISCCDSTVSQRCNVSIFNISPCSISHFATSHLPLQHLLMSPGPLATSLLQCLPM